MAERKAVNKYYPPEWTPQKGSVNKFRGTHALRERARKLHLGILIIRFEMPFNIWCEGCGNHIGMGVRYNAEKTKVGMYYTTPIYKFRMKCHLCSNHFEIQTDPQNLDYVILNGARRQERRWDPTQNEQVAPEEKDVSKKLATDSMYRLEHGVEDKKKQKALAPSVAQLEEHRERWKDDYSLNKTLRQKFREKKKVMKLAEDKDRALLVRSSLELQLLPETSDDAKLAGLLKLTPLDTFEEKQRHKREEIISRPIFSSSSATQTMSPSLKDSTSLQNSPLIKMITQQKRQTPIKSLTASQLGIIKKGKECDTESIIQNEDCIKSDESHNCRNISDVECKSKVSSLVAFDYGSDSSESDAN